MNSAWILLLLVIVMAAFGFGVLRTLLRIWLEHRVRLAVWEQTGEPPSADVEALAGVPQARRELARQDYVVTGALLAALGGAGVVAGQVIGLGNLAVGLYLGGFVCIGLGILILLLGFLIRALARGPHLPQVDNSR